MNPAEVAKFQKLAREWWDPAGSSAALHALNPVRTKFTRDALCHCYGRDAQAARPLEGLTILDVGCGGGLFSEALARLGAQVTGIDASEASITVATAHAAVDPAMAERTSYRNITAEQAVTEGLRFDAVVASEVIEHVDDVAGFSASLAALTKPGGGLIVSTINRTLRSYALAVVAAEYVLGLVPKGTHQWERFVTPDELAGMLGRVGLVQGSSAGMFLDPLSGKWSLSSDMAVNYIAFFKRPAV